MLEENPNHNMVGTLAAVDINDGLQSNSGLPSSLCCESYFDSISISLEISSLPDFFNLKLFSITESKVSVPRKVELSSAVAPNI